MTKRSLRRVARPLFIGAALLGLGACYYEPPPPPAPAGYAYAPQPGYYAAPAPEYYAPGYAYPPVVGSVNLGFGWGGGDRGGGGRRWR